MNRITAPGPVGQTLERLRRARRLTQADVAARARLTRSYISKLETGKRPNPSADTVEALARALLIPVGDFYAEAGMSSPARVDSILVRVPRALASTVHGLVDAFERRVAEETASYRAAPAVPAEPDDTAGYGAGRNGAPPPPGDPPSPAPSV